MHERSNHVIGCSKRHSLGSNPPGDTSNNNRGSGNEYTRGLVGYLAYFAARYFFLMKYDQWQRGEMCERGSIVCLCEWF